MTPSRTLTMPPITRKTLAEFAEASGDHNPIHLDPEAARASGLDDVIAHGMLLAAYAGRAVEAVYPDCDIRDFSIRFTRTGRIGDVITVAVMSRKAGNDGEHLEVWAVDQNGEVKLEAELSIAARHKGA
ncbi:MaoC/PaaZ C-terminal domain-containing protein [Bosea sp. (in: a-proteobacteria)]|uniref:MaoC/PaaZ C-terminal domain-containing protein n=1 Tax=Bosea sp. (in: a-proteobacteria) TaxID=1871050 RepID=UPI002629EEE9|nr:MaoC/PaaZ C-terminal domain-containing protein [Bosea sp. (in: a-proteobacteria)]MCO5090920.1 MaoC family dehydratase N-terminal domain-containing protein [Bosea sp. (in: a-proteobacteria)]